MSLEVKNLIIEDYRKRFEGVSDAVLVDVRALKSNENTALRADLRKKDIRVTVVRNELIKKAFEGSGLAGLGPILSGPSAMVYGGDSVVEVARVVLDIIKTFKTVEVKGAVLDGQLFSGKEGIDLLSKFPTRDEAQAQVVQVVLGPAAQLASAIIGPGAAIGGILKAIEEKFEKAADEAGAPAAAPAAE